MGAKARAEQGTSAVRARPGLLAQCDAARVLLNRADFPEIGSICETLFYQFIFIEYNGTIVNLIS